MAIGMLFYLLGWSDFEEDICNSYCLDKCNHKADVVPNAQKYSCYLNEHNILVRYTIGCNCTVECTHSAKDSHQRYIP